MARARIVRGDEIVFRHEGGRRIRPEARGHSAGGRAQRGKCAGGGAAARLAGVDAAAIAKGVRTFAGVEHRLEFVAEIGGVQYYNDSKATNVDATLKALDAFPGRILIILGGKDKGSDYTVLQKPLREKAILALLIGAAAEKIEKQIAGSVAIERAETLERAVEIASHARKPATWCCSRRPAPASTSFKITSTAAASSRSWCGRFEQQVGWNDFDGKEVNEVPRRLETDRWLFGVTLVLCLIGAVMIFSASAVTAQNRCTATRTFSAAAGGLAGDRAAGNVRADELDYRRLREPAVVYTVALRGAADAGRAFFLDKSHATHRWISSGPVNFQPSELAKLAVILYLAWFLDLRRRRATSLEFSKQDFLQTILPAVAPDPGLRGADCGAAGPGHRGGYRADRGGDSVCRGTVAGNGWRWEPRRRLPALLSADHARRPTVRRD